MLKSITYNRISFNAPTLIIEEIISTEKIKLNESTIKSQLIQQLWPYILTNIINLDSIPNMELSEYNK